MREAKTLLKDLTREEMMARLRSADLEYRKQEPEAYTMVRGYNRYVMNSYPEIEIPRVKTY